MKYVLISTFAISMTVSGCGLMKKTDEMAATTNKMSQTTSDMAKTTSQMSETTSELARDTATMKTQTAELREIARMTYLDLRHGDSHSLRMHSIEDMSREPSFIGKLMHARSYFYGVELQMVKDPMVENTEREAILRDQAMQEFLIILKREFSPIVLRMASMRQFVSVVLGVPATLPMGDQSVIQKTNELQNLYALASRMSDRDDLQDAGLSGPRTQNTILSLVEMAAPNVQAYQQGRALLPTLAPFEQKIGLFEPLVDLILKMRADALAMMALSRLSGIELGVQVVANLSSANLLDELSKDYWTTNLCHLNSATLALTASDLKSALSALKVASKYGTPAKNQAGEIIEDSLYLKLGRALDLMKLEPCTDPSVAESVKNPEAAKYRGALLQFAKELSK